MTSHTIPFSQKDDFRYSTKYINMLHKFFKNIYILLSVNVMNRRNIILLINKGQVDQGNVGLLMLVLGIGNDWTRMWSTVYLEYFVLDSTMGKSKGE